MPVNQIKNNADPIKQDGVKIGLQVLMFLTVLAMALMLSYAFTFRGGLSSSQDHWGQFGDLFGGVLNPFISLAALLFLIKSFNLQKTYLNDTRNALTKQSTLQTFFQLLQQHRELVNSVELKAHIKASLPGDPFTFHKPTYSGRAAFSAVIETLKPEKIRKFNEVEITSMCAEAEISYSGDISFEPQLFFAHQYQGKEYSEDGAIESNFGRMQRYFPLSLEMSFGHIFRSIFQILKFAYIAKGFTADEKHDLVNYLRAQMSEDEFILYALSALTKIGEKSRGISIAFDFFENRMHTVEWAKPMRSLLDSMDQENIDFAKSMKFELVK